MAEAKETSELAKTAEQITAQAQRATENYFDWVQKSMSALPWSNTDLNKKLLNYATESVAASFALANRLMHAQNLQDVVKIQTEFMEKQINIFNERVKELREAVATAGKSD